MTIEKTPFVKYNESESLDVFTIRLNEEERKLLDSLKLILQQEKDGTAFKQLALEIGAKVLQEEKVRGILEVVLNNYRKNKRLGIVKFD